MVMNLGKFIVEIINIEINQPKISYLKKDQKIILYGLGND